MSQPGKTPCHCGSGKKYKWCCKAKDEARSVFQPQVLAGGRPIFAGPPAPAGASGPGLLFPVPATDRPATDAPTARIDAGIPLAAAPPPGPAPGSGPRPSTLALLGGVKRVKVKSGTGLYAMIHVDAVQDTGQPFFDIHFGGSDEPGPPVSHLALCPEGGGRFVQLAGQRCELESGLAPAPSDPQVQVVRIRPLERPETLELQFSQEEGDRLVLTGPRFIQP